MKRVSLMSGTTAAIASALMGGIGATLAPAVRGARRVVSGTKRGRQMVSVITPHNRSKYMPHIGAKEQARAERCYMSEHLNHPGEGACAHPRCSPTMCQASKRNVSPYPMGKRTKALLSSIQIAE